MCVIITIEMKKKMDNGKDSMNGHEMIAMLEQLKQDIDADIERRKAAYTYIGKDGKYYYDKKDLDIANKAYIENIYKFIGRDGREYSANTELEIANKMYQKTIFSKVERNDSSSYEDIEPFRKMK